MTTHRIEFPGSAFAPVELADLASLPLHLNVQNSPLLFGCRSGLCGTCLIEVESLDASPLEPPDAAEAEALEIYAPGNPRARLACQFMLSTAVRIRKIQSA
jgi:ferredoxin